MITRFLHRLTGSTVLGSVLEALVLVFATLFLCGLYLYFGKQRPLGGYLALCGILIPLTYLCAVAAAYWSLKSTRGLAQNAVFEITPRLIRTLRAEKVPLDVRHALSASISGGQQKITGEANFVELLETLLGKARAGEVKVAVLKYARV